MIQEHSTRCGGMLSTTLLLAVTGVVQAQADAVVEVSAAELAEQRIEVFLEDIGAHGFGAAVWADGDVAWSRQWGLRDKERELPVDAATMFRIGSVTKLITAMALASMAEREELDLDATIDAYLPDLPDGYTAMTPRMLAGHLAGVRHYDPRRMQQEFLSQEQCDDQASALARFVADELVGEPGKAYFYSTYGFTTLGAVMEQAAGKPLIVVFRERVFEPAGMMHTYGEHNEEIRGELAVPYASWGGQEMTMPSVDNSCKLAGAGIVSTPIDLARFLGAVGEHRLVSGKTTEDMFTSLETADGQVTGVGIGWRVAKDGEQRRYVHHGGSAAGGRAFVLLYPDAGVGVALCMNLSSDAVSFDEELALEVAAAFLD